MFCENENYIATKISHSYHIAIITHMIYATMCQTARYSQTHYQIFVVYYPVSERLEKLNSEGLQYENHKPT